MGSTRPHKTRRVRGRKLVQRVPVHGCSWCVNLNNLLQFGRRHRQNQLPVEEQLAPISKVQSQRCKTNAASPSVSGCAITTCTHSQKSSFHGDAWHGVFAHLEQDGQFTGKASRCEVAVRVPHPPVPPLLGLSEFESAAHVYS